jgi:uncharacterized protein (TIGR02391 family)
MASSFDRFERIVRQSLPSPTREAASETGLHPFDQRNIHQGLPSKVKDLFDDGHFAEATEKAFAYIEHKVQRHSGIASEVGWKLMLAAFDDTKSPPLIRLTPLSNGSDESEQSGYRFVFGGSMRAIRNPRAHGPLLIDDPDTCLDHLSFASMLLRRLEQAGYV